MTATTGHRITGEMAPMGKRLSILSAACMLAGLHVLAGCSGGGTSSNAAPRISSIPQQSVAGGAALSLDVGDYTIDREGASLTYTVASGGGSFAGSTYSHTFATMGTYTVEFDVADGVGKTSRGEFRVEVTSAKFAVVGEGTTGLLLADADTDELVRVASSVATPVTEEGLTDGRMAYTVGNPAQLWVFDPMTRTSTRLSADATGNVNYVAKTSDDRILYTAVSATRRLLLNNPTTGVTRALAEEVPAAGAALPAPATVLVNGTTTSNPNNVVFFTLLDGGQGDIYYYDISDDSVVAVSTASTDERLVEVLPNGALVFSRVGGGGETDLFYFRIGTGLVEVAAASSTLDPMNKTFVGEGTGSQVVFTASDGTDTELYSWAPGNGQVATIHSGGTAAFAAIGSGNEVVYTVDNGGGDVDAFFYDLDSAITATVRNAADTTSVFGIAEGSSSFAIVQGSGATSSVLAVSLVASPVTTTHAGGGAMQFERVLGNGDALARRTDGTAIAIFDASATSWSTISGTGLDVVGAGVDDGDFVYEQTASSQVDLAMWDASGSASVDVSTTTGDDTWQATTNGKVYFVRDDTYGNANLFVFKVATTTATQLTESDANGVGFDYTVQDTYSGTR